MLGVQHHERTAVVAVVLLRARCVHQHSVTLQVLVDTLNQTPCITKVGAPLRVVVIPFVVEPTEHEQTPVAAAGGHSRHVIVDGEEDVVLVVCLERVQEYVDFSLIAKLEELRHLWADAESAVLVRKQRVLDVLEPEGYKGVVKPVAAA